MWKSSRVCSGCQSEFTPTGTAPRFCSDECRTAQGKEKLTPRVCRECGLEFTPRRKDAVFCKPACKEAARHRRRNPERTVDLKCLQCQVTFKGVEGYNKYCSVECRQEYSNYKSILRYGRKTKGNTLVCRGCGVTFVAEHGKQEFCTGVCRELNHDKELQRERYERYKETNKSRLPGLGRKRRLKYLYGISPEEYDALLEAQNGVCAICGGTGNGKSYLQVDHCHLSGKHRSLLCGNCNKALGLFGDRLDVLASAYWYLKRHNEGG